MSHGDVTTDRLRLRPPVPADAERLADVANDMRIARNLTSAFPHPYTIDDANDFINSKPQSLAVELRQPTDPHDIGVIGVFGGRDLDGDSSGVHSFGYWLAVDHWGRGYATEAGRAYLDQLIASAAASDRADRVGSQPLRRVEASVYGWNPASARVLTKLGFTLEGRRPNRIHRFGDITDELLFGMNLETPARLDPI